MITKTCGTEGSYSSSSFASSFRCDFSHSKVSFSVPNPPGATRLGGIVTGRDRPPGWELLEAIFPCSNITGLWQCNEVASEKFNAEREKNNIYLRIQVKHHALAVS